ncbi:(2Fe-2S)-binding protein [Pseudocolwellia agarivorans]|uniref:(2Fe-2S)-binding protein n=1 Tax=Pseudocolwellia agarivorans TaxID=1911682 RepID=UPI0015898125|nr:(2Fe-2S)-binding protein [Pseudocolwellia agarivorans]
MYNLSINGKSITTSNIESDTPLLWLLRDELNMAGTKYGCGKGLCGACTVHMNGNPIRSCQIPVAALGEQNITTIEGIASDNKLHPIQQAWHDLDVAQCGYCQAGQIMSAVALLKETPKPTDEQIEQSMAGNICRCGTYVRIKQAIKLAAGIEDNTAKKMDYSLAKEVK